MIRRALLSAWDKSGLVEFAQGLQDLGVDLVASGGTAEHLAESGIHATPVEELTEIPEMLGGRVKTLHPRIHAAILARRDHPDDLAALDDHGIEPIDLVCVGFYPFTQIASRHGAVSYFASDRTLPWWAIAISNTATYQSGSGAFIMRPQVIRRPCCFQKIPRNPNNCTPAD